MVQLLLRGCVFVARGLGPFRTARAYAAVAACGVSSARKIPREVGPPLTLPSPPHLSHCADQVALAWFALDATTHLTIELIFLVFATLVPGGAEKSNSPLAFIWKEVRGYRGRGWRETRAAAPKGQGVPR